MKRLTNVFVVFQLDHYQLLGVAYSASSEEIEAGYVREIEILSNSKFLKLFGFLWGRTESKLKIAKKELLDPVSKADYDAHLDYLRILFCSHPY
jgi:hypothetical protein